jgi:signal transduction histidine kinase
LIYDNVQILLFDSFGKAWIFTNYGFSVYEPALQSLKSFKKNRDIPFDFFYRDAVQLLNDTLILAPADGGLLRIQTKIAQEEPRLTQVFFESVETASQSFTFSELNPQNTPFTLPYSDRNLKISFIAPDFKDKRSLGFEYRLAGADEKWTRQIGFESVQFKNLSPGDYEFQIRPAGLWYMEQLPNQNLWFSVDYPFWRQVWFFALLVIVITAFAGFIFRQYRLRKQALDELRVQIAGDLHDEIGASLTKISIQAGLLGVEKKPDQFANRIKKIEDSSREIIRLMSDIIWAIDSRKDSIADLINRMKETSFDLLDDQNISFDFHEDIASKQRVLPLKIRESLFLIYKEALTNSVKHANCSKIEVSLSQRGSTIELYMHDDGKGFRPESLQRSGNGLKNMEMRAARIRAQFQINGLNGTSLSLKIELPKIPFLWD